MSTKPLASQVRYVEPLGAETTVQAKLNTLSLQSDKAILSFPDITAATSAATKLPNGQQVDVTSEQKRYRVEAGALVFVANLDQLRIDWTPPIDWVNAARGRHFFADVEGFVADDVTDNSDAWDALQEKLKDGDRVDFLGVGKYYFSRGLDIVRPMTVSGIGRFPNVPGGTVLRFTGQGVTRKAQFSEMRNITIEGITTNTILDFENRVFGNVGLKEAFDGVVQSSAGILNNVTVKGFDVNRLVAQEGTAIWAGAYREAHDVRLTGGRFGHVSLDGDTHDKYWGGQISGNTEGGLYADCPAMQYNRIELHGTTMEANGKTSNVFGTEDDKFVNIYSGRNTRVSVFGGYNEALHNKAENGGEILYFGTHQHSNCRSWAVDGSIADYSSHAPYANILEVGCKLAQFFRVATNVTKSNRGLLADTMRVQSSHAGQVLVATDTVYTHRGLSKHIKAVKLSFSYKFNSGFSANSDLVLAPIVRLLGGGVDTQEGNRVFPVMDLKTTYGEEHHFEFFHHARFGGPYLNPEAEFSGIDIQFRLRNGLDDPDFSADALDLDIRDVRVTLFSDIETSMKFEIRTQGTTAERPVLDANYAGFIYFDSTLGRSISWSGTAWDVSQMPGTSSLALLGSAASSINTTGKYSGKIVTETTAGDLFFSLGATPTSKWRNSDGTGDITPV